MKKWDSLQVETSPHSGDSSERYAFENGKDESLHRALLGENKDENLDEDPVAAALRLLKARKSSGTHLQHQNQRTRRREDVIKHEDHEQGAGQVETRVAQQRVIVAARVRPLLDGEEDRHVNRRVAMMADPGNKVVTVWLPPSSRYSQTPEKAKRKSFHFDHVFEPRANQAQVYLTLGAPLVDAAMQGINGCLIAYGQTGAGKTFTTFGQISSDAYDTSIHSTATGQPKTVKLGLIPRAVHALFEKLDRKVEQTRRIRQQMASPLLSSTSNGTSPSNFSQISNASANGGGGGGRYSYALYVTYYQIYLDSHIQDLLDPGKGELQIRIADDNNDYHRVDGLSTHRVTSVGDVLELLERGDENKVMAQTSMNATSSRSHSIFTLQLVQHMTSQNPGKQGVQNYTLRSKLTCVDLAGSERASRTQPQGLQLEEAKSINRSLAALGNVIAALSHGSNNANASSSTTSSGNGHDRASSREGFVPWRDSKLTRVLRECLDGKSRVSLVINVGPGALNVKESINSLLFGRRSMSISVRPQVNKLVNYEELARQLQDTLEKMEARHREEIADFEDQLLIKASEVERLKHLMMMNPSEGESETANGWGEEEKIALEKLNETEERLEKLQETHDLLEEALMDQLEMNGTLEQKLRQVNEKSQKQSEEYERKVLQLSEEKHRLTIQMEAESHKVMELEVELGDLREELDACRSTWQLRMQAYENQLMSLQESTTLKKTEGLEERLRIANDMIESYKIQLVQQAETIRSDLEEEFQKRLQAHGQEFEETSTKRLVELEENKSRELEQHLGSSRVKLEEMERQFQERLTCSKDEAEQKLQDVTTEYESRLEGVQHDLEQSQQVNGELENKCNEMENRLEMCLVELEQAKDEISKLMADQNTAVESISKLRQENETLLSNFQEMGIRVESAEEKLQSISELQRKERQLYETLIISLGGEGIAKKKKPSITIKNNNRKYSFDNEEEEEEDDDDDDDDDEEDEASGKEETISSPRIQNALQRSRQALARAMEAINDV